MKYITKIIATSFVVSTSLFSITTSAIAAESQQHKSVSTHNAATQSDIRTQQQTLAKHWVDLWNGNYDLSKEIVSPSIHVRAALMDGGDGSLIKGPAGMIELIKKIRAAFPDLNFRVDVGPIIDGDHIVIRWIATGTYGGGFPGATAAPGTKVTFTGADILKVKDGLITDYWLNADTLLLISQLKVVAPK